MSGAIEASGHKAISTVLRRIVFSMRLEEFLAFLFFWPMAYFTLKAYLFFRAQGNIPKLFNGDMQRLGAVIVIILIAYIIARKKPAWSFLRDALPFAYCLAIYTNLHDTVHFVNPFDIQNKLITVDQWMFGVQPSVWAERFIHPWLTESLSFCYMLFFILTPIVAITLYIQGKKEGFRETLVTVILCFYTGYFLYLIFPAVSPSIALKDMYTVHLNGTPIADALIKIVNILPSDARDAFPSLHTAVTLLTLIFAYKYVKWEFWLLLPIGIGLILGTVYLRHHYVIDLIAGAVLSLIAYFVFPKLDNWWRKKMRFNP
jgi:membrane-associated phospholipid phosphatase